MLFTHLLMVAQCRESFEERNKAVGEKAHEVAA